MANEEHLKILEQGVEVWNQWRKENVGIQPDLSGADLREADLSDALFYKTDFTYAKLVGANFSRAHLGDAKLYWADLRDANLSGAYLGGVKLCGADLRDANLSRARLKMADLTEANLSSANLSRAYLGRAKIIWAKLRGANLKGANLRDANLDRANLCGANLQNSLLYISRLLNANLDEANLTGARLWETQRAGWSIKGVVCEYVYWDKKAEKKSTYRGGEFEKLFADLTKVQLSYKGGMSLLEVATLPSLIQHLTNSFPECSLRLMNMQTGAGGAVVELAVEDIDDLSKVQIKQLQAALETEAQQRVQLQRKALAESKKRLKLEGEVAQLSLVVDKLIQRPTYKVSGQAGAVGDNSHSHDLSLNQTQNRSKDSAKKRTRPATKASKK
jgi:uncharacterized protein YjbI with pentapeptide repeats